MLRQIRSAAKSWIVILLMGLLVVSFAIFGVGDAFTARFSNAVIQAGGHEVSPQQFQAFFTNYRSQLDQQQGRPVTDEELAQYGVVDSLARQLGEDQAFSEILTQMGVRPGDAQVAEQIRQERAFFDPVTGRFSPELYRSLVSERLHLTAEQFEASLRDEVAQQQFAGGVIGAMRVPRAFGAFTAAFNGEARGVSWMVLTPQMVTQPGTPTDAQLTAFMNDNIDALRRPEFRVLSVVRFSAAEQGASAPVPEAEVVRTFEFRRDSLSQPERRSFVQIPVRDAAAGARVVAALRAGGDPAAVARSVGAEPVPFADQPRSAVPDEAVAAAAFSLSANQVSDVIRGGLGLSVIKLTSVTPAVTATLEQARPTIERELRARAANDRVSALVQRYEESHNTGANLGEAARAAGLTPVTLPAVTARGQITTGAPSNLPPQLLQVAFGLPQGGESDVEQGGEGEYYAVRVDRIIAPAPPPLAEIRPQLVRAWTTRQLLTALQTRAAELTQRVQRGEDFATVGRAAGATVNSNPAFTRDTIAQSLGQQVAASVFQGRSGEVVSGPNAGVFLLARIDRVASPAAVAVAPETEAVRDQLRVSVLREMAQLARQAASATINPRIDMARARTAAGIGAEADAGAGGGAGSGAGGQRPPAAPAS